MRHFEIRRGEWPSQHASAPARISADLPVQSVALLGADTPGLRPIFEVEEGAHVGVGQVLFRDRRHPAIAFVSPAAGRVSTLAFGPRRTLSACIVDCRDDVAEARAVSHSAPPGLEEAREALLERGFWPAFRTRPFGRMPGPEASPAAIFVNAVHAWPAAPDPVVVLSDKLDDFHMGIRVLSRLTEGETFVCQSRGAALGPEEDRITYASFGGSLAAGLASTHIDRLWTAAPGREVWTIGYQDVAAVGHIFRTGAYDPSRVVAIGGPVASGTRLVRTRLGARIADLCQGETGEALSGGPISGRSAAYLGRFDNQITVVPRAEPRSSWLKNFGGGQGALIPTRALERALAVDIPAVPLLRALAVGDTEAAERLGCLALVEEDVAALSRRCTSGADYALLLREVLDELYEDAA